MPESQDPTRRSFLKAIGTSTIAAALSSESPLAHAQPPTPAREASSAGAGQRLADLVNPLQGTDSSPLFSRGNTLPLVAMPFGMAHWTLQTHGSGPWFFRPADQRIEGIRCTHQLSPWLSDYGYATFLPFNGDPSPEPGARASSYRPRDLKIAPHSLELYLLRYRTLVELAPTERCAILRITFPESGEGGLFIDIPGADAELRADTSTGIISGLTHANEGGVPPGFAAYYQMHIDAPLTRFDVKQVEGRRVGVARFSAASGKPVIVRIATSFISSDQAARNLQLELGQRSFDTLRDDAAQVWESRLARIAIEGGTDSERRIFYSALYRASLFPRIWHEPDPSGNPIHRSPYNGSVVPGVMYADHGYWDVYRAWYPLMALLDPARLGEILQAWVNASKEGGWLPQFPCPGYRACMTGSLIDSVFGDAAAKRIAGFDVEAAYQALKKHATQPGNPERGYGRRGIEDYLRLGYIPVESVEQSCVETLDSAYGDFCIAQVARAAGHPEDGAAFLRRSQNWRNVFDLQTRFMRGKTREGQWLEPFNPFLWGTPYVEGAAWQHRFSAPHDVPGLIEAMGGAEPFTQALELMLTQPPRFDVGIYGKEIHEMSEMAAVEFGQYAHSNQPVHHILYLFAAAGKPQRTQYWVRRVLKDLYTPDNFAGDEDTGSMAAWYVLSALGFYPLCPGTAEYVLGSPLFDRATLHLPGARPTTIECRNQGPDNVYVQRVTLQGSPVSNSTIPHDAFTAGSTLSFNMSARP